MSIKRNSQTRERLRRKRQKQVVQISEPKPQINYPTRMATWFANLGNGKTISYKQFPNDFLDIPYAIREDITALTLRLGNDSFTISKKHKNRKTMKGFFYMQREYFRVVMGGGVNIPLIADRIGLCYNNWGDAYCIRIEYIYNHFTKNGIPTVDIRAKRDIYRENIKKKMEWYNPDTLKFEGKRIVDIYGNMVPGANMDGALHLFGAVEQLEDVGTLPRIIENNEDVILSVQGH